MAPTRSRQVSLVTAGLAALVVAGCAGGNQQAGGGPGAAPLPSGRSCQDVRRELDRLDARGVPSRIEAANSGGKLSPAQRAEVEQYNGLLQQYLGARCHM